MMFMPDLPPQPPNIVYVLTDDQGYGDVSCLNPESKIRTPFLDRMAREGMIFTDAHSNSAVCTPTRYGILTGRYAWRTSLRDGVLWGFSPPMIPTERLTVAALLKQAGYQTSVIGKWHLGLDWALQEQPTQGWHNFHNPRVDWSKPFRHGPTALGFDHFFGISASLDMPPYLYIENDRLVEKPTVEKNFFRKRVGPSVPSFEADDVLQELGRRAVAQIESSARKKKPFFLYLPLTSPHTPIAPSADFKGRSGLGDYADFVIETDWIMGNIRDALERSGVRENTLVIFTSDNGCSPEADYPHLLKNGHNPSHVFRGTKADLFEGGHRVPFIVSWPARIKAGSVCNEPISLTDLMATAADLVSFKLPPNVGEDSVSMLPYFEGRADAPTRPPVVHQSINGSLAIRKGKWKLLFTPGSGGWSAPKDEEAMVQKLPPVQLYNLEADVGETTNVAARHPDVVAELQQLLEQYIARGRSTPGPDQANDVPVPLRPPAS